MPSFWRFMNNMMPPMANDAKNDVDMAPQQMDNLMQFQLSLPHPRYLNVESLILARIVGNRPLAVKLHKELVKHGFIQDVPATNIRADPVMTVNTLKIDKTFPNKLAIISVHAQRKLVGLLFFWEEECNRWRLLDQEEAHIMQVLGATTNSWQEEELQVRLRAVHAKKFLLPSRRAEGASTVFPPQQESLPVYYAQSSG